MKRGLATVAQGFHRKDVAGVKHRGDNAERVPEEPGGGELEARVHEQRDTGKRRAEPGEEQRARPLAEKEPCRQGDEDRREVSKQRRVRDRGELNRAVPEREVAGEREPRREEQGPLAGVAPRSLLGLQIEQPQEWNRDRHAPKSGGGGPGLGQAHEDRRERYAGGAGEKRDERGVHAPRMLRERYLRSFQRFCAAS